MSRLRKKALRDLWRARLLFGAIVLMLATGVGMFVSNYSAFKSLEASEAFMYEELRFADVFAHIESAPPDVARALRDLEGVEAVEGRLVKDVPMQRPDDPASAVVARIVSVPDTGRPTVNDVAVRQGAYLGPNDEQSVLLDRKLAEHYGLRSGEAITLLAGGRVSTHPIAGTFTSPEYVWKAKSDQEPFVAGGEFAIVLMRESAAGGLLDDHSINEVLVRYAPGADIARTTAMVEQALSGFGIKRLFPREEQISYELLKLDLEGFGEIAVFVPSLFLIITALVTYTLLTRTAQSQRALIGLMRAVGFSRRTVLLHYLTYPLVVAVAGSAIGIVLGLALGSYIAELYVDVVGLPFSVVESRLEVVLIAAALGLAVSLAAGILPARAASRLNPSEAMRTAAPSTGRRAPVDRSVPTRHLPYALRLALRNLLRSRGRSLSSITGVTMAVGLVVAAVGMIDTMDHAFDIQFDEIQRYDLKLSFSGPVAESGLADLSSWEETAAVEPVFELPVVLGKGDSTVATLLTALRQDTALLRLRQDRGDVPLSTGGLFLATGVAGAIDAGAGDTVLLLIEGSEVPLPVAGTVDQPLSGAAYARLADVQTLLGAPLVTGALIELADGANAKDVTARLHAYPGVLAVERPGDSRRSFEELMSLFYQFVAIFVAFGISLGSVAVFNMVTINVFERSRELATMRALGFGRFQVDLVLTLENLVAGVAGVLLGLVLGYGLEVELMTLFETELFSLEVFISPLTYLIVGAVAVAVILLSEVPGIRALHRIDLAAATKERG